MAAHLSGCCSDVMSGLLLCSWLQANCNALSLLPGKVQTELNPELSKERRSCPLCQRPATAGSATIDGAQPFYDRRCNAADVDAGQPHLRCSTVSSTKPSKQASHQAECRPRQSERQWFQRAVRTLRHKGCIAGQPQWLKAAGRYMTGAVQSGLEPTEADLCNPQTCSCLLELLLLLPDRAAGTACCTRRSFIQGVGGSVAACGAGQCYSKCDQASCF